MHTQTSAKLFAILDASRVGHISKFALTEYCNEYASDRRRTAPWVSPAHLG